MEKSGKQLFQFLDALHAVSGIENAIEEHEIVQIEERPVLLDEVIKGLDIAVRQFLPVILCAGDLRCFPAGKDGQIPITTDRICG